MSKTYVVTFKSLLFTFYAANLMPFCIFQVEIVAIYCKFARTSTEDTDVTSITRRRSDEETALFMFLHKLYMYEKFIRSVLRDR